jgi:predicted DNA binding CopG/RHH family protein
MKPTLKRQHIVQTALNDAELAALRKQADAEGLSMTAFIRQLIIKNASVRPIESRTPEDPT